LPRSAANSATHNRETDRDSEREKQIAILNDHYNQTYRVVELVWAQRNRVALYLYIVSGLLLLLTRDLHDAILNRYFNNSTLLSIQFVCIVGALGVLAMCILLTQRTTFLDKHYLYLKGIEERINFLCGFVLIARESHFYSFDKIPKEERIKLPIRYHILYDAVLIFLVLMVLLKLWAMMITTEFEFQRTSIAISALLTAGFVYVLGMFYIKRNKIKNSAERMNQVFMDELRNARGKNLPGHTKMKTKRRR